MTTSTDPEEIRADIERTRASLSENVDRLTESAAPSNVAKRQVDKVKDAAGSVKDKSDGCGLGRNGPGGRWCLVGDGFGFVGQGLGSGNAAAGEGQGGG